MILRMIIFLLLAVITGDFSVYTSVGADTWGPPVRTGNTPEITAITLK